MPSETFWQWLVNGGYIQGDPAYYSGGQASPQELKNAFTVAWDAILAAGNQTIKDQFWTQMVDEGYVEGDPAYYSSGQAQPDEYAHAIAVASGTDEPAPSGTETPKIQPGTIEVGTGDTTTIIPTGMRLVRITDPAGTDFDELYLLVGTVFGAEVAYEIGSLEDLEASFGGIGAFDQVSTMTQKEFDASDTQVVGTVDEIAGSTGSLQAQYERDMRAAGLENPPAWLAGDEKAMATYVTAVNEGWSAERTWGALASTDAFKQRFDGLDVVMGQLGTTSYVEGIGEFVGRETAIRQTILATRGPNADTSPEYVSSLIGAGWQPAEVAELLDLEKRVKANPEALDNINAILRFQGLGELTADDFVSFLQQQDAALIDPSVTPGELFEGVNDALRFQALMDEGLNISEEFATELGEGTSDAIGSTAQYSAQAQMAAMEVARNADELALKKYGLDREDIIAAQFNEVSPTGKSVSEINEILQRMGRERARAATGFTSVPSYTDALGRLRVQGFSNL